MQRSIFCRPAVINGLARILAALCPKSAGSHPVAAAESAVEQLQARGYTDPITLLSDGQVAAMRDYFDHQLCNDPWRPHLGLFEPHTVPSPETNMGWYTESQILDAPHMIETLTHPLVLSAVEAALGCKPTLGFLNSWWAYPERAGAKGSQRFHRDFDGLRFIKLFIYLTDVDETTGPHVYVADSADDPRLYHPRALTDPEVADTFGDARIVTLTGKAGTCFLADTRGIHKGMLPAAGSRLAVIAQYALWRSAHQIERPLRAAPQGRYDPYVMRRYLDFQSTASAGSASSDQSSADNG